jgi:hypothetical protein
MDGLKEDFKRTIKGYFDKNVSSEKNTSEELERLFDTFIKEYFE